MDKLRTLTDLSGSVLDLASGPFSLGSLYRDVVSVDINPQYIKSEPGKQVQSSIS